MTETALIAGCLETPNDAGAWNALVLEFKKHDARHLDDDWPSSLEKLPTIETLRLRSFWSVINESQVLLPLGVSVNYEEGNGLINILNIRYNHRLYNHFIPVVAVVANDFCVDVGAALSESWILKLWIMRYPDIHNHDRHFWASSVRTFEFDSIGSKTMTRTHCMELVNLPISPAYEHFQERG